jgi:HCOMODA/2-hydroxy-3-carboxy-muconic semialdehyde decarboxylase
VTDVIDELCVANRILSHEGVLDAFGHVSVRHPTDPNRYLLARSRSPLLIEPNDIFEYKLDSEPVKRTGVRLYSERVIHGSHKAMPNLILETDQKNDIIAYIMSLKK